MIFAILYCVMRCRKKRNRNYEPAPSLTETEMYSDPGTRKESKKGNNRILDLDDELDQYAFLFLIFSQ